MSLFRTPLAVVLALTLASPVLAEEALEKAVVRHRTYTVHGKLEVSLDVGIAFLPELVNHDNFTAGIGYNLSESWALEARAGYAVSGHTTLATHLASDLLARDPYGPNGQVAVANDLSNLWEMKANAVAGVRWAPLYGKLSLFGDTSVRFQAYLWAGAGVAMLHRQSVVYCSDVVDRANGICGDWLTQDRTAFLGSAALGMRFFSGPQGALRLEVRNYLFKDTYLVNIDRTVSEAGGATGQPASGVQNLVLFDLGYSFFL
jgi:outer membrane beta-barrel protein